MFRETSLQRGLTFLRRLEETAERLSRMPEIGSRVESDNAKLANVRLFNVNKHPDVLLAFRPLKSGGIQIVRVLHGARDVAAILERTDLDDSAG